MFANLVRLALVAEACAWAALWSGLGAGPAAAIAAALAGAALLRLAIVALSFALSFAARSPRAPDERLGPAASLALLAGEWGAMLANNFLWLPLERAMLRPDPPAAPGAAMPVIVVHGYFSNRGTVRALVQALDRAGAGPVHAPSLPAVLAPIATFASHLARVVDEVTAATGQPRVILVCHSMGGLCAREYLRAHGAAKVAGLVTLGSPHHGTALAALGAGRNAREMRRGSGFLAALAQAEDRGAPCPALSVYTTHDNLVAPQDSSRLAWARNAAIAGVGHLAMLADPRVHRLATEEIARLRAAAGPGG